MVARDRVIERLTNLTFAFLNADRFGRKFLSPQWIHQHVDGYAEYSAASFHTVFTRDRAILAKVGVPIESVAQAGYRLQRERYMLPPVSFTPAEATVLGLAGELGFDPDLGAFARSGWTKLAAGGADRMLHSAPRFTAVNDISTLSARHLDSLLNATRRGDRIEFQYRSGRAAQTTTRTMDPWGIVNVRDRLYLVGFDIDRDAPRSFRITRVGDIAVIGGGEHPRPDEDLQHVVEKLLRTGQQLIDAHLSITPDRAYELSTRGTQRADGTWDLIGVDQDWLIRTAAAYAPHAVVLSPSEIRDAVVAHLHEAEEEYRGA
ncbi:YafY family protein [Corynebacterium sp.]|uniref:helix-turn-helix transcriptional regulator n=1 Tax=Corynebacterium sp. TaxID=1720 RepID=UPI0026DB6E1F|nr:WYL domain-containing protein [Corynebacterium sp.]MDO5077396.1 WYL domain-containing protein [Corynebacterium sp.]